VGGLPAKVIDVVVAAPCRNLFLLIKCHKGPRLREYLNRRGMR
jgi:hypothetical protein